MSKSHLKLFTLIGVWDILIISRLLRTPPVSLIPLNPGRAGATLPAKRTLIHGIELAALVYTK